MSDVADVVSVSIRKAAAADMPAVVLLDERDTGQSKPDYWQDIFDRYVAAGRRDRFFLVAETGDRVVGFIVGEVRAWEFGSPPSGWVFAISVAPDIRERGIASQLFETVCQRFLAAGVATVRTMISREDALNLSFFRSQGLSAGPYIQLEMHLDE